LRLTINRPQVLNALNVEAFTELKEALALADDDPQVQVVVVTGAGRGFCTGADLKVVVEHHASEEERAGRRARLCVRRRRSVPTDQPNEQIVVAMVNGPAYGGGLVLAASSDIAVVSDRAQFRIPEGLAGIADELSTTWLVASVGVARAKYLILTAEPVFGSGCGANGTRGQGRSPRAFWRQRLRRVVSAVLNTGPRARGAFKRMINEKLPDPRVEHIIESHLSAESLEGCLAFVEKRAPSWAAASPV